MWLIEELCLNIHEYRVHDLATLVWELTEYSGLPSNIHLVLEPGPKHESVL